ncbi:hypothetical protein SDC9_178178 [bioreactor metagenome]|uniref:Uncharacterized protein n=1 Tax=bioreactor metagenome TaxID=1076179 RepID=A0A645GVD9_9ZZZZ
MTSPATGATRRPSAGITHIPCPRAPLAKTLSGIDSTGIVRPDTGARIGVVRASDVVRETDVVRESGAGADAGTVCESGADADAGCVEVAAGRAGSSIGPGPGDPKRSVRAQALTRDPTTAATKSGKFPVPRVIGMVNSDGTAKAEEATPLAPATAPPRPPQPRPITKGLLSGRLTP